MESLDKNHIAALLDAARKSDRDYLAVALSYQHALRASECCSLKVSDFDRSTAQWQLTVNHLKHSETTCQPVFPETQAILAAYIRANGLKDNDYIFAGRTLGDHMHRSTWFKRFQDLCISTGVIPSDWRHPHVLRHSMAHHIIQTAGIMHTKQYLAHRSIKSTAEYLKSDDKSASAAVWSALGLQASLG